MVQASKDAKKCSIYPYPYPYPLYGLLYDASDEPSEQILHHISHKWGNCIWANSSGCDRLVRTDLILGEQGKFDKSELRPTGNCIEVGRHSTAKIIRMKTEKTEV